MSDTSAKHEDVHSGAAAHSIECAQQPTQRKITLSSFETVLPAQSDSHHVVSTGNYYQTEPNKTERNGFGNYTDDEGQEWESDEASGEL